MKIIAVILILSILLATGNVNAQSKSDVVYLKNGSILRGKVIDNEPGVKTTIEIVGSNIIVIPDSVIRIVEMDQRVPAKEYEIKGYPVEMASAVSFYGGSQNSGGFTFITSYRFPFRLSVGVGIGIEWFDHQQIPFMADAKYYFIKGSLSPYIYAQGGYAVPLSQEGDDEWTKYKGGMLAGTGAGMRFNFTKRNALFFSLGYRYQKIETVINPAPWSSYYPQYQTLRYDEFNRLTFTFGFLFN